METITIAAIILGVGITLYIVASLAVIISLLNKVHFLGQEVEEILFVVNRLSLSSFDEKHLKELYKVGFIKTTTK